MAFAKTGISISSPRTVKNPDQLLQPGDKRDGKVWDGKKWVSEEEWLASQKKNGG
jgi:hypothetical protein